MSELLSVEGLRTAIRTSRRELWPVDDVTFGVERGEAVAIVGESGCGKTMTARSIMRLLPTGARVASGRVMFEGQDLATVSEAKLRKMRGRRMGMVFQDPMTYLNPLMTVGDQVAEVVLLHEPLRRRAAHLRAVDALDAVRIPSPERAVDLYPHQLSGGMRQRVLIAMATVCGPSLLIADEPTTALDVTIQRQVMRLLTQRKSELSSGMLLITHDLGLVAEYCDRAYVMYAGRMVESGTVEQLFRAPLHPYTQALFAASLRSDRKDPPRDVIPGAPPDLRAVPGGCRFHPRCPVALDRCAQQEPGPIGGPARWGRCWLVGDV